MKETIERKSLDLQKDKFKTFVIKNDTGKVDLNKPVKLMSPENRDEAEYIFKVTNYNEHTKRVYITPINHDKKQMPFPGEELISINEVENV